MKINITGRKCTPRDSFKDHAEKKLSKVARFFDDDAEAKVTATVEKSCQTRLEKRLRTDDFDAIIAEAESAVDEEEQYEVVRTKAVVLKPESVEEAILQMNLLGHKFYMFRNAETAEINVVYKRNDGGYGVLVPEVE